MGGIGGNTMGVECDEPPFYGLQRHEADRFGGLRAAAYRASRASKAMSAIPQHPLGLRAPRSAFHAT